MEDIKDSLDESKPTKFERFKGFVGRHKGKIILGVGTVVIIGGTVIFFSKKPEYKDALLEKLQNLVDKGESIEIDVPDENYDEYLDFRASQYKPVYEIEERPDLGETYSARRLGDMIGLSAQQVNKKLKELGYIDGEPGRYYLTDKGKEVGRYNGDDNGMGGYARQTWAWIEWKKDLVHELGDPDEYQARIERIRAEMPKFDWNAA